MSNWTLCSKKDYNNKLKEDKVRFWWYNLLCSEKSSFLFETDLLNVDYYS